MGLIEDYLEKFKSKFEVNICYIMHVGKIYSLTIKNGEHKWIKTLTGSSIFEVLIKKCILFNSNREDVKRRK
mgnify:CR=1 FL=1